eukprot:scaffold13217_cov106-Skeletonema_marinoi.AAC.4
MMHAFAGTIFSMVLFVFGLCLWTDGDRTTDGQKEGRWTKATLQGPGQESQARSQIISAIASQISAACFKRCWF